MTYWVPEQVAHAVPFKSIVILQLVMKRIACGWCVGMRYMLGNTVLVRRQKMPVDFLVDKITLNAEGVRPLCSFAL